MLYCGILRSHSAIFGIIVDRYGFFFCDEVGGTEMGGDLHCHTKLSDGSLGIEDLITLAKKRIQTAFEAVKAASKIISILK